MKHIIATQQNHQNFSTGTGAYYVLAVGTENPDPYTNATNVRNGSIIRAITIQFDVSSKMQSDVDAIDWYVGFNIAGQQTMPDPTAVNASKIKNQIFHQDGALFEAAQITAAGFGNCPRAVFRVTIAVPRAYQQINLGDQIELHMKSQYNAGTITYRLLAVYKEIFP